MKIVAKTSFSAHDAVKYCYSMLKVSRFVHFAEILIDLGFESTGSKKNGDLPTENGEFTTIQPPKFAPKDLKGKPRKSGSPTI